MNANAKQATAKYELDLKRGTVRRIPRGEASMLRLWRGMAPGERATTLSMLDFMQGRKRKPTGERDEQATAERPSAAPSSD